MVCDCDSILFQIAAARSNVSPTWVIQRYDSALRSRLSDRCGFSHRWVGSLKAPLISPLAESCPLFFSVLSSSMFFVVQGLSFYSSTAYVHYCNIINTRFLRLISLSCAQVPTLCLWVNYLGRKTIKSTTAVPLHCETVTWRAPQHGATDRPGPFTLSIDFFRAS